MGEATVDRDALVEWFHQHGAQHQQWPCIHGDNCGHFRVARDRADALLASGVLTDAAQVRADERRKVAAALLEALARAVIVGVLVWLRREQAREAT